MQDQRMWMFYEGYAWVQFKIIRAEGFVGSLQSLVPDEALFEENGKYGRETEPHVTVLYGLDPDLRLNDIRSAIEGAKIPGCLFGFGISYFENDSRYNVLKLDILPNDDLAILNDILSGLPTPGATFPDFKPHMTIAYVKKEWMLPRFIEDMSYPVRLYGYLEFCNHGVTERI